MKQLLFLLLFPCFAMAQYPGNSNQKITLGEQTTADGLVYRGVLADTGNITPFSDTSAYIILDTVNNRFYNYNRSTNVWSVAGGGGDSGGVTSFSAGTTGLTPSTATTGEVTLGGTLAVANGGTGKSSLTANKILVGSGTDTIKSPTNLHWDNTNSRLGIGTTSPTFKLDVSGTGRFTGALTLGGYLTGQGTNPGGLGGSRYVIDWLNGYMRNFSYGANSTTNGGFIFNSQRSDGTNSIDFLTLASTGAATFISSVAVGAGMTIGTSGTNDIIWNTGGGIKLGRTNLGPEYALSQRWTGTLAYIDIGASTQWNGGVTILPNGGGNVGIGTTSPSEKLHVVGNGRFTAVGAGTFANNLNITSDGTLTTSTSDEKYKYNILPINYGLNTILQLKPVNFQWIEGEEQDLGFIAQDVADIIPEAVNTNWNSDLLMRYESIIPILTKAIQEQTIIIKQLEDRILILENK